MRSLPRAAQVYVCGVVVVGFAVFAWALVHHAYSIPMLIVLLPLYALCDFSVGRVGSTNIVLAISAPIALAAILMLGTWGAVVVCSMGVVDWTIPWFKRLFNGMQAGLSALAAGSLYYALPGHAARGFEAASFPSVLVPIIAMALAHLTVNYILVATAVAKSQNVSLVSIWRSTPGRAVAVGHLGYSVIGLMMASLWSAGVGPIAVLLVLAPLLLARWAFQQFAEEHKAYERTVASLIQAVETKDLYTRGHSERVSKASVMIGHELNMREDRVTMLRHAGMLHDVGKLGVPTAVLQKNGALDDEEFASIRLHPTLGLEMVGEISFLEEARKGIKYHHERMDGRGYPEGLSGYEIPEFARIISVADAFDSMTSTRSYRGARSVEEAVEELRRWSGAQFDPPMVNALITAVEKEGWEVTGVAPNDPVLANVPIARDHDDPSFAVRDAIPSAQQELHEAPDLPAARAAT